MKKSAPVARYTSRNQFANMLDRRAKEMAELAERIRDAHPDNDEAAVDVDDAVGNLQAAAKWLRDPVK